VFGFTAFDIIVLVVLIANAIIGIRRGFTTEALKLASWGGAIFITIVAQPFAVKLVSRMITVEFMANIIGLGLVFLISLVALNYLGKFIGERIKSSIIGPLDRLLGSGFGFVRGVIIVCGTYLAITQFVPEKVHPEWVTEAKLLGAVKVGAVVIADVTPDLFEDAGDLVFGYTDKERDEMDDLVEDVTQDDK